MLLLLLLLLVFFLSFFVAQEERERGERERAGEKESDQFCAWHHQTERERDRVRESEERTV